MEELAIFIEVVIRKVLQAFALRSLDGVQSPLDIGTKTARRIDRTLEADMIQQFFFGSPRRDPTMPESNENLVYSPVNWGF